MKSFEIGAKKTHVFYLHGLRGHALSQQVVMRHMVKNLGIKMISLELPGHGSESQQRHCLVPAYEKIVEEIVEEIRRHTIQVKQVVLMGHSFGGTLMALVAGKLDRDKSFSPEVVGMIGISTAFDVGHNVPRWQLALSKAIAPMSRFFFEKAWRLSNLLTIGEMNIGLISADDTVRHAIEFDPLVYKGRIPLATSAQVYLTGIAAKKAVREFDIPTLLLHSLDDEIALAPKQGDFGEHVELKLFKNLRHNCIDGVSREAVTSRRYIFQFIVNKL